MEYSLSQRHDVFTAYGDFIEPTCSSSVAGIPPFLLIPLLFDEISWEQTMAAFRGGTFWILGYWILSRTSLEIPT